MIEVKGIGKYYGDFKALNQVSFTINKGEIIGFLGPNGAGKTTTMRILTGFLSFDEGSISIAGLNPEENPIETKKRIGYLPENPLLYEEFTVGEFLLFTAEAKSVKDKETAVTKVMEQTGLLERRHQLIRSLSRGFKQRVGLAAALLGDPEILILDEPTSGLDPNQVIEIRNLIKEMSKEKTIILSTHILPEVEEICNRVIVIDRGEIKAVDTLEGLRKMANAKIMCIAQVEDIELAKKILSGIDNVKDYEVKEDGLIEIFLSDLNERKGVVEKLTKAGLYEFFTPQISLEAVFHQLTLKEEVK